MKKSLCIFSFWIVILLIVMGFILGNKGSYALNISNYKEELLDAIFTINNFEGELYSNSNGSILVKYNTVFVPMNEVFSILFTEEGNTYDESLLKQTVTYKETKLIIDRENNLITVPFNMIDYPDTSTSEYSAVKNYSDPEKYIEHIRSWYLVTVDNSIEVEIEEYDNVKYIPVYLLSNFDNIEIKIDGSFVYDIYEETYINSIGALISEGTHHLEINITNTSRRNRILEWVSNTKVQDNSTSVLSTRYIGEEFGSLWREEAYKRIEKYRKGNVNIIVQNNKGEPIEDAIVNLTLNDNEFNFGVALDNESISDSTHNYDGIFPTNSKIFNMLESGDTFKWALYNNASYEKFRTEIIDKAVDRDLRLRGHCLWWDFINAGYYQDSRLYKFAKNTNDTGGSGYVGTEEDPNMEYILLEYESGRNIEEIMRLIGVLKTNFEQYLLNHVEEEVNKYPEIDLWDVFNEPLSHQYFKYYLYDTDDNGLPMFLVDEQFKVSSRTVTGGTKKYTYLYDDSGNKIAESSYVVNQEYDELIKKLYQKARDISINSGNDDIKLTLNDNWQHAFWKSYVEILNDINSEEKVIDFMGYQGHIGGNGFYLSPQNSYNFLKKISEETGVKVEVTEFDNFKTESDGTVHQYTDIQNQIRADYYRDYLLATYSNTDAVGFVSWVYNDMNHFSEEEHKAYEETVYPWLNDSQQLAFNDNRTYSTRAYIGNYSVKVSVNGREITTNFDVISGDNNIVIEVSSDINTINAISLNNGTINEVITGTLNVYTATINDVSTTIELIPTDSKSILSWKTKTIDLDYGKNIIEFTVTSESGIVNSYQLIINRPYVFETDYYKYDLYEKYLYTGMDDDTDVIIKKLALDGVNLKIVDNYLIISNKSNEELEKIKIVNFKTNYLVENNYFVISEKINYDEFMNNIETNGVLIKVFDENNILVDNDINSLYKVYVYYNDILLDTYKIKNTYLKFNEDLEVDNNSKILYNISSNITYDKLLKFINTSGSIVIKDKNDNVLKETNIVKTGDYIEIDLDGQRLKYRLSVLGDITGDGYVDTSDVLKLHRYILGKASISDRWYIESCYINSDDEIDTADVLKLHRYVLGKIESLG